MEGTFLAVKSHRAFSLVRFGGENRRHLFFEVENLNSRVRKKKNTDRVFGLWFREANTVISINADIVFVGV